MYTTLLKATLAELLGTFCLSLVVASLLLSLGSPSFVGLYAPAAIAISFGLLTYVLLDASGAQLNPAVSFALFCLRELPLIACVAYILAQIIGAYLGVLLAHYFSGNLLLAPGGITTRADFAELIGTAIFAFAVGRVAFKKVGPAVAGLVTGGALFVALTISQIASGGVLNPAVALALGSFHLSYLLMPFIGALLGVWLARFLPPTT